MILYKMEESLCVVYSNKRKGIGVFFKIDSKIVVLTCFNVIGHNNIKVTSVYNSDKLIEIPLKVLNTLPELNIAVLELTDISQLSLIKCISYDNILKLDKFTDVKVQVLSCDIHRDTMINQIENISEISIHNDYLLTTLIPKIPLIRYSSDDDPLSGSLLFTEHKIIGMVSNRNDSVIEAIPMILIYEMALVPNIRGFVFSSSIADINDTDVGHIIMNPYDFQYKIHDSISTFKFKYHDTIFRINDMIFNNDGTIFDSRLGTNLNLDTAIMFNCSIDKKIKLNYYRDDKEHEKELIGTEYNKMYQLNMFSNDCLNFKGLVFTELSEEHDLDNIFIPNRIGSKKIIICTQATRILHDITLPIVLNKVQNNKFNSLEELKLKLERIYNLSQQAKFSFIDRDGKIINYIIN